MSRDDGDADVVVIERSRAEPARFAEIYDRHAAHIKRYLVRRIGTQAADDALNETFLAAFGKRHRYDRAFPDARPWLYGIATRVVGQYRRDEVREYRLRASLRPADQVDGPADRVAAKVTAQAGSVAMATALSALSDGDRDVLLLIAWEGLSYEEVATALAIPVGTVRSRLNRARRKVRGALESDARTLEEINHG
ncbi:RNA polymerase sigma factor [Amycolatopsis sp. YIM 10]|uniref:RNA polymerase sigma factor n=1 Tax=Amycolatopsis sp. YIM 10 TaxID=2653857 RepID=UPI00128FE0A4|nr:RNA polymerase sigma factor [Amycolatopsis sp. YIM 10]QFU92187.1 ECF RNA polymerase sigma factor SigL [Amycolatopsis sp. YIM 10]